MKLILLHSIYHNEIPKFNILEEQLIWESNPIEYTP
jgi:hypothetical protein